MLSNAQIALKKFGPTLFLDLKISKLYSFLTSFNNFLSTDFFLLNSFRCENDTFRNEVIFATTDRYKN